jgi:hypothetical protein
LELLEPSGSGSSVYGVLSARDSRLRPRRLIPARLRRHLVTTTVILMITGVATLVVGVVRMILD